MEALGPWLPALALGALALLALRVLFGLARLVVALGLLGAALWYLFGT